jgi:hypothetical protein
MFGNRMVFRRLASAVLAASIASGPGAALADIGPKPTMTFAFTLGRPGLTITSGVLLMCQNANCADAQPLKALGPQGFACDAHGCAARAYGFAPFARLKIRLSDGRTLSSNIFSSRDFDARFKVVVGPRALDVQPAP